MALSMEEKVTTNQYIIRGQIFWWRRAIKLSSQQLAEHFSENFIIQHDFEFLIWNRAILQISHLSNIKSIDSFEFWKNEKERFISKLSSHFFWSSSILSSGQNVLHLCWNVGNTDSRRPLSTMNGTDYMLPSLKFNCYHCTVQSSQVINWFNLVAINFQMYFMLKQFRFYVSSSWAKLSSSVWKRLFVFESSNVLDPALALRYVNF